MENEQLGLAASLTDDWIPEKRERFCSIGKMTNLCFKRVEDKRDHMNR